MPKSYIQLPTARSMEADIFRYSQKLNTLGEVKFPQLFNDASGLWVDHATVITWSSGIGMFSSNLGTAGFGLSFSYCSNTNSSTRF